MNQIALGDLARDVISGFEGVVTGETMWLNGCVRYMLEPRQLDKDGKPLEPKWFDAQQVGLVEKGVIAAAGGVSTGGPPTNGDPNP